MDWLGLLNICKVPGMSSHEVVARIRRIAEMKRVGHTGTLDPAACGVLPICLGSATRLAEYIAAGPKGYRAEILLGVETDSGDAEGDPLAVCDASHLREEDVLALLPSFTGTVHQRPPVRSAIQIGGRRAYDMARQGEEVHLPTRQVTIHRFTPIRFEPGTHPRLLVDLSVSKGTYIRSLARDIGEALGVGGTLSFLARTQVGDCLLEDAVTLEEVTEAAGRGQFADILRAPDAAITYIPALTVPPAGERYQFGTMVPLEGEPGLYRVYYEHRFLGLGRLEDG